VRFVSSGTEATMSALRLARAATGRDKVLKFAGAYHGHVDGLLAEAGSGLATQALPTSPGVPAAATANTVIVPWNDSRAVRAAVEEHELAAILCEPFAANMGLVPPADGFLELLRDQADASGALLLFDEVITGFRLSCGGAQEHYGVTPDLTTLGKIIGGGLPLAAYGGRVDIMDCVAPAGPVYQAGTLSGNPLAVAAGLAQITRLDTLKGRLYEELDRKITRLAEGVVEASAKHKIPVQINRVGSMMTVFFTDTPVVDYATAKTSDTARFGLFFRELLERGVYIAPSQFEAAFVSTAHAEADLDATVAAVDQAFAVLAAAG